MVILLGKEYVVIVNEDRTLALVANVRESKHMTGQAVCMIVPVSVTEMGVNCMQAL